MMIDSHCRIGMNTLHVPQPRRVHDLHGRSRSPTATYKNRDLQHKESLSAQPYERDVTRHRLTWFETLQGLLFLAVVMVGKSNGLVTNLLICGGIVLCVPTIIATCVTGVARHPLRLVLANFWGLMGTIHLLWRMS
jgi:hypothetical protein